ncbi:hypothetical protein VTK73DRAFT_9638 [Phialemonium thermophilum]|uniref:Uncharacterized protein n=1 Tax=Phialemonium thermophilum TaxID=223376 RepID=A0ABR3W1W8_9PEZI
MHGRQHGRSRQERTLLPSEAAESPECFRCPPPNQGQAYHSLLFLLLCAHSEAPDDAAVCAPPSTLTSSVFSSWTLGESSPCSCHNHHRRHHDHHHPLSGGSGHRTSYSSNNRSRLSNVLQRRPGTPVRRRHGVWAKRYGVCLVSLDQGHGETVEP